MIKDKVQNKRALIILDLISSFKWNLINLSKWKNINFKQIKFQKDEKIFKNILYQQKNNKFKKVLKKIKEI